MAAAPDYASLIAGHSAAIEMINSGDAGLPALTRLLRTAEEALGTAGTVFAEYGPTGGRIVAATGVAECAIGRPVPSSGPAAPHSGPAVRELSVDDLPDELANQLRGRGLHRLLSARVAIEQQVVGSLNALYPMIDQQFDTEHQAVLGYLAGCVAHLYRDRVGLPVHGDGPALGAGEPPEDAASRPAAHLDSGGQRQRDHDRDLFVAVTSHELRTPVTVIKGYADTLNEHWDSLTDGDRRQAARIIGQRAGELARLVDRLLLSATHDAGPVGGAPPTPFDLLEALRATVVDLPADLRQRLVGRLPRHLPKALGDRTSLATVLTELATNAGKYSADGSPVELFVDSDERTVAFRVADRGIGIHPEHVERAFDRFWQGETGDRRRYPGVGLGLYLVRRIVERQNGWVSLRPREGGGTVAEVRLPRG